MNRTRESGAFLGGIGAMLHVEDVCVLCGQLHPEPQFGISHGEARECPRVVLGSFPVITEPEPEEIPSVRNPGSQKIREFEFPALPAPVSLGSVPTPRRVREEPRPRSLEIAWLPLPDVGGL